jgi:hypothetical protein
VLYIVTYGVVDKDEEKDSKYERAVVYRTDAFWDLMPSDDTYCMDSDEDTTTMPVDEGVGNTRGVIEDEDVEGRRCKGMMLMVMVGRIMLVGVMVGKVLMWRVMMERVGMRVMVV